MAKRGGLSKDGIATAAAQRREDTRAERNASLHRSAKRALELTATKTLKAAKSKTAKGPKKPKRFDDIAVDQVVTREAQTHGEYREVDFKLQEVTEGGKRKDKTIRVVRNLGGTPVERWYARGALDERQMAAILFYQNAHRIWVGQPRVVANWSAVIVRGAEGAMEIYAGTRIAAKESLRLLDQEVFFREPVSHFHVWQNVVIWDEPAGVAGGRVGFVVKKSAEAAARVIVGSIAHKIADIVIDQSRRDFGDLLLDLDAPRRPGRKMA